jgi:hypothetical protein
MRSQDGLPIEQCIPQHALVTAIQITMQRIKIKRDNVAVAHGGVENRRAAD